MSLPSPDSAPRRWPLFSPESHRNASLDKVFRTLGRQTWLRFAIRDRLIRAYCDPDRATPDHFQCDFFGLRYDGRLDSFIDWNVYFYGAYERQYLVLLERLAQTRPGCVFVDVGANVGHHSLFMSRICAEVHAFEPNPHVRARMEEKLRLNGTTNVFAHEVGLAHDDGELPFFLPSGCNEGTGSFVPGYSDNNEARPSSLLRVVNGDRYIDSLGLKRVDLVKIDVEGFERSVLAGMQETLRRFRPIVTMEFSPATRKSFLGSRDFMGLFPCEYAARQIVCDAPLLIFFNHHSARTRERRYEDLSGDLLIAPAG